MTASNLLVVSLLLAASAVHFSQLSAARHIGAPVIYIKTFLSNIHVDIKAGGVPVGSVGLIPGSKPYFVVADGKNVSYASAIYGSSRFTSFIAFDPYRDNGRMSVHWRADDWGFEMSYDNKKWTKVAQWESE